MVKTDCMVLETAKATCCISPPRRETRGNQTFSLNYCKHNLKGTKQDKENTAKHFSHRQVLGVVYASFKTLNMPN